MTQPSRICSIYIFCYFGCGLAPRTKVNILARTRKTATNTSRRNCVCFQAHSVENKIVKRIKGRITMDGEHKSASYKHTLTHLRATWNSVKAGVDWQSYRTLLGRLGVRSVWQGMSFQWPDHQSCFHWTFLTPSLLLFVRFFQSADLVYCRDKFDFHPYSYVNNCIRRVRTLDVASDLHC